MAGRGRRRGENRRKGGRPTGAARFVLAQPFPVVGYIFQVRSPEPLRLMSEITCVRCGLQKPAFDRPPFPGAIGQRIVEQICQDCWAQWLRQQTMLINHYGLNVMDPQARSFLKQNMQGFLFKSGAEEEVDTSKKGTIQW